MFGDQNANKDEFFQKLFHHSASSPAESDTSYANGTLTTSLGRAKESASTSTSQMTSARIGVDSADSSTNVNSDSFLAPSGPLLMDQLVSHESLMPWSDTYSIPVHPSLSECLNVFPNDSAGSLTEAQMNNITDYRIAKMTPVSRSLVGRISQLNEDNLSSSSDGALRNRTGIDNNSAHGIIDATRLGGRDSSSLSSSTSGGGGGTGGGGGNGIGFNRSYSSVLHSHDLIQMDHSNLIPKLIPVHDLRQQHSFNTKPSSSTPNSQSSINSTHQLLPNLDTMNFHQQVRQGSNDLILGQPSGLHLPYQSGYYNQNLSLNSTPSQDRSEMPNLNILSHNPTSSYFHGRNTSYSNRSVIPGGSNNHVFNQSQVGKRRGKLPFFINNNNNSEGQHQLKGDIYKDSSNNSDGLEHFSRKVFVGGLPPDIDEEEIKASFRRFGPLVVDWPHKAESKSYFPPKGYAFLLFHEESSVQALIDACLQEEDKLYLCVSSPTIKDKPVQIRPWRLSDADFVLDSTLTLDPRKTVFVGGVPRPLKASELATIMNNLYGGVCYAGIDTDPELKYPKGAGRVAFSNHQSYIAAISARFVHLHHSEIEKRVEVKPYVLDDQFCDECQGSRCGNKFAPFFCANITCLRYYCESCWSTVHSQLGREFHKPLVKEGAERPRGVPYRWN